jgi:Tol biopolymer transport system component
MLNKRDKMDSRLRGNDVLGRGNDVLGRGNDVKRCPIPLALLLLCLLLALSGCERKPPPEKAPEETKPTAIEPVAINLKETRLATIPDNYERWDKVTFSADGRQVFYMAVKAGKQFVVVGNKSSDAYESVSFLAKSSDGRRFAFGGKKGEGKYLVVDNKELRGLYHEEVAPGAFSPDGRLVACEVGGLKEGKWFIFVSDGDKEVYRSQVFPNTFRQPAFSPDGRLLVYELGDDRKRIVFFLDISTKRVIKERTYIGYDWTGSFSFSSDSSRVIHELRKGDKIFLVLHDFALNEEREIELPYAWARSFVLSPDGKKIAYTGTREEKPYLVVSSWESPTQGKESGPYEGIGQAVFSPDATTTAFRAMRDGKWRVVVGDREGPGYDGVERGNPVFSPDGARIAYPAMKGGYRDVRGMIVGGKWAVVASPSNKPGKAKEGPAYDMVVTPVWSPDGRYIAYRARTGSMEAAKRFIVIADPKTGKVIKEGPVNDEVWPPVWSTDGKAAAYGVRQGRELWWRVELVE